MSLRAPLLLSIILLSSSLTGCVSYWRGQEMHTDMVAMQGQIDQLREDLKKTREKANTDRETASARFSEVQAQLRGAIAGLQSGSADFGLEVEKLHRKMAEVLGELANVQKLQKEGTSTALPNIPEAGAGATPLPTEPSELYRYGWERKSGGDCDEAIRAFATFVRKFPANDRADNSLFLLADCQHQRKENAASIRSLQTILRKHSKGDKVDDALVLMHDNFVAMKRCKDAMPFLETLLADYPRSNQVKRARKKLARTKKRCKK